MGWWQIDGGDDMGVDQAVRLDFPYIENWWLRLGSPHPSGADQRDPHQKGSLLTSADDTAPGAPSSPREFGFGSKAGSSPPARLVLGMRVDAISCLDASRRIVDWAGAAESRYVCAATVNNVIRARDDPRYQRAMNGADLTTPDGMPLVWALWGLGIRRAEHVRGTDLTVATLRTAAEHGIRVGFYGASADALGALLAAVERRWPRLEIAYAYSPPSETSQARRPRVSSKTSIPPVLGSCSWD